MIINDNTKKTELLYKGHLSPEDLKEIEPELYPIIHDMKLFYLNNTLYYVKSISNTRLLHELIGVYLAKQIGLDTVLYQIGFIDNQLYAISPIFFQAGHEYSTCKDYYHVTASKILVHEKRSRFPLLKPVSILKKVDNLEMLDSLLKLIALDLKMGQYDRHNLNITLDTYQGTTSICPIYDYSASYENMTKRYANPFVILKCNPINIWYFTKMYPNILPYFSILRNTSLITILEQIEKDFNVIITDQEKEDYNQKDEVLNRLLLK